MTGNIIRTAHKITREEVRRTSATTYYVFGDNLEHKGLGGLARVMRNESNVVGIPTKHYPSMDERAFFDDDDMYKPNIMVEVDNAIRRIDILLQDGYDVVIPMAGIGTGLAQLPQRAPRLFHYIEQKLQFLERKYNPIPVTTRTRRLKE